MVTIMTKKTAKSATEVESPTLTLDDYGRYCARTKNGGKSGWACESSICELFEIEFDTLKIRFVAKAKADSSTYRTKLTVDGRRLTKPISAALYFALSGWLVDQIAAGRPHIGVRIIK